MQCLYNYTLDFTFYLPAHLLVNIGLIRLSVGLNLVPWSTLIEIGLNKLSELLLACVHL